MKNAIIVTENSYPCGDAGALRQHVTAKILQALGYSVFVIGYGKPTPKREFSLYEGVQYCSMRPSSKNKVVRLFNRIFFGFRAARLIKKKQENLSLILVVDTLPYAFRKIKKRARQCGALLVHDSVEWYSPEEFKDGARNISYRLKERTNCHLVKRGWRVMAISTYLQKHFQKQADKAVRIPVIADVRSIPFRTEIYAPNEKTRFVYVGSPGRKDYLKEMLEAFCLLEKELLSRIELHLVGINEQQLFSVCEVEPATILALSNVLVAHGRLPHEEAKKHVLDADYSLLFRDANLRYAKAGFPTKIVESLSCGTPPVCNLSSDLGLYLKDGENAFLAEGHSPELIKFALEKAVAASIEQREFMRKSARTTAENHFDYTKHITAFKELLS